ncbi:MAG: Rieske 2Fe-2S domain-containing protein [Anaerolineaceae bacterium]|nr:Rieske 2Fe-2S domain-containing protein [Anaerolineaceae bacterium]
MSDYVSVCPVSDIPEGHREVFGINDHWVAIFCISGRFYAIEDLCTHDGNILTEDSDGNPVPLIDETVIKCPRHGARFDVTSGKFLGGPAGTVDLPFYGTRVEDGMLQVTLNPLKKPTG